MAARHALRDGARAAVRSEEGSASPLIAALVAVAVTLAVALTAGAGLVADRAAAQAAADLAALAAARVDRDERAVGASEPVALEAGCAEARAVAKANGAGLVRCARGAAMSVEVEVVIRRGAREERAESRAGARSA